MFERFRNIWRLSAFRPEEITKDGQLQVVIKKDFPTIEKKMATIIPDEKADLFNDEIKEI